MAEPTNTMADRMRQYQEKCPRAGEPFPDQTLLLLDGKALTLSSLQGRPVVIQTGSYT